MTLDEAIETQETYIRDKKLPALTGLEDAMWLGIESLKFEKIRRKYVYQMQPDFLPGETEE